MTDHDQNKNDKVDWLTVIAIAAMAISVTVSFHEGIHALACSATGGHLKEYAALYVDCDPGTVFLEKFVAGSAPIANILVGLLLLFWLRRSRTHASRFQFFLWLCMLTQLLYGSGYWIISGIANFGDWAVVIRGLNPAWAYRLGMTALGALAFMGFVWVALKELGKIIGGAEPELYGRTRQLTIFSYLTSVLVILFAGALSPHGGLIRPPAIGGIIAVLGALSPLLWMTEWFHAKMFIKDAAQKPLDIPRHWGYIIASGIIVFVYGVVLGQGVAF